MKPKISTDNHDPYSKNLFSVEVPFCTGQYYNECILSEFANDQALSNNSLKLGLDFSNSMQDKKLKADSFGCNYRSEECSESFDNLSTLNKHLSLNHRNNIFECSTCGQNYKILKIFKQHKKLCKLSQHKSQSLREAISTGVNRLQESLLKTKRKNSYKC
jgi:hypothetical protein